MAFVLQHSVQQAGGEGTLKYLGFFPAALTSVFVYLSAIYEVAKDQAGPLKPAVEDVEEVLKTVLKPVLRIAEDQSTKLLDYVDKRVDEKLKLVDDHIPDFIRPIAFYAQRMMVRGEPTPLLNARNFGLDNPASSHQVAYGKEVCSDYPTYGTFEKFVAGLHLQGVVRMLAPGAVYSAQLFNQFAGSLREAHVPFCYYIPDVPIGVLERALKVGSTHASWQAWQGYECEGAC